MLPIWWFITFGITDMILASVDADADDSRLPTRRASSCVPSTRVVAFFQFSVHSFDTQFDEGGP